MTRPELLRLVLADTAWAERWRVRFWSKVNHEPNTGCWLWGASLNGGGYGIVTALRAPLLANRVSFALTSRRPDFGAVLHRCGFPPCVNPAHLYEGDQFDNVHDMHRHGTARRGLTLEARATNEAIRAAFSSGLTKCELARRFRVSMPRVYRAVAP